MTKANVMVYPVDVAGLPLDHMWDISQPAGLYIHPELTHMSGYQLPDMSAEGRDGMKEMASRTGGKSCTAGNNIKVCLDQALSESSDYYLLGFYVSQQQRKAGWHKLKVTVNAYHGEVRSRNTYFLRALGTPPQREQEEDLRSAILAPVDYTGIIFTVEPGTQAASPHTPISFKVVGSRLQHSVAAGRTEAQLRSDCHSVVEQGRARIPAVAHCETGHDAGDRTDSPDEGLEPGQLNSRRQRDRRGESCDSRRHHGKNRLVMFPVTQSQGQLRCGAARTALQPTSNVGAVLCW